MRPRYRPGGWAGALLLVALVLLTGCRGRRTLSGKTVATDDDQVKAFTQLIEKAIGLIRAGKEKQVLALAKKDLPRAEQAAVVATLKKVARAQAWRVERVQRFGKSYFRVLLSLDGNEPRKVTVNFLRQDDRIVFTGGG